MPGESLFLYIFIARTDLNRVTSLTLPLEWVPALCVDTVETEMCSGHGVFYSSRHSKHDSR